MKNITKDPSGTVPESFGSKTSILLCMCVCSESQALVMVLWKAHGVHAGAPLAPGPPFYFSLRVN